MGNKKKTQVVSLAEFNKQCIKANAYATIVGLFTERVKELTYRIGEIEDINIENLNTKYVEETLDNLVEQIIGDIDESIIRNC